SGNPHLSGAADLGEPRARRPRRLSARRCATAASGSAPRGHHVPFARGPNREAHVSRARARRGRGRESADEKTGCTWRRGSARESARAKREAARRGAFVARGGAFVARPFQGRIDLREDLWNLLNTRSNKTFATT